jgi:hypothetical protein
MRFRAMLFAIVLVACGTTASSRAEPEPRDASLDTVVQFLIESAATDFHTHRATSNPGRFRNVRVGHVTTANGEKQYLMCGEFLPVSDAGKTEWLHFATIKTSGYEQWIGGQSIGFCKGSVVWDKVGDLSAALQSRLTSLRP